MKQISLLGSTGSIGRNVLKVVQLFPDRFKIVGLAAGRNIKLLREQIFAFTPELVSVADQALVSELLNGLPAGWSKKIVWGRAGNELVASLPAADITVSAIVGSEGLMPTLAAIKAGKDIALANKETLVMAGHLVMKEVQRNKVRLLPVDSEHSAIFQALEAGRKQDVARILLTASGGPFLNLTGDQLRGVTPEQALMHPNWDMGRKISIDSATLMNKGLEVIEARWLFDIDANKIEVLVHPQSVVHSLVEFVDGSVVAQMGIPDMRIPIGYALSYPERLHTGLSRLDLVSCSDLSFQQPDYSRFPALTYAYKACECGGTMPTALNAANEVAVDAFLAGRIRFPEIAEIVGNTLEHVAPAAGITIEEVLAADDEARLHAQECIDSRGQTGGERIHSG
jgi:1-deoxy-D-xylulose-5-phosphate reductoisomerase